MDVLEKVRQWLITYPEWETGNLLYLDFTDGVPGNSGLYPQGLEIASRKENVLGQVTLHCRYHFTLYRVGRTADDGADARWLLGFQDWVLQQSAAGLAPRFGDEPGLERIRAEQGKLREKQPATDVYAVNLTAEFVRKF